MSFEKSVDAAALFWLLDYAVALLFPSIPELVVVIYRLKNRRVGQLPLQPAFAASINFFFVYIRQNLQEFLSAFGAVVGSVNHLFCVFRQNLHSAARNLTCTFN